MADKAEFTIRDRVAQEKRMETKADKRARESDEARAKARETDEKVAEDIRKAVFDRTHDGDGDPKPIVEETEEG